MGDNNYWINVKHDRQYLYITEERDLQLIDHKIGVAFPTRVDFKRLGNCLYRSVMKYKGFSDSVNILTYLEEITEDQ